MSPTRRSSGTMAPAQRATPFSGRSGSIMVRSALEWRLLFSVGRWTLDEAHGAYGSIDGEFAVIGKDYDQDLLIGSNPAAPHFAFPIWRGVNPVARLEAWLDQFIGRLGSVAPSWYG